ncbi:hypothetical protein O3G_MSEX011881 [Manduca sexta]|uniref:C2H2-type domain-containing protein n=2 Tax=Manduca sexta TaxID=7130 RepID=A0A921ZLN2_MANSE|nr:hypothetical protein O3G_MSEX011881 [Manduca sexta]
MTVDDVVDSISNDDCLDDLNDVADDADLQIKEEPTITDNTKSSKMIKRRPIEDIRAKKELMLRMKRTKEKLNKLKERDKTDRPIVTLVKKKTHVDKEYNAINNAITMIECSYVCPFFTIYSDYYCIYCKEMFTDADALRAHTLTHDPVTYKDVMDAKKNVLVDIDRIDCRLCQANIDNIDSLKCHLTKIHGKIINEETSNEFLKFKLRTGKMSCTECGRSFNFFQALRKHMAEHFGTYICDVCGAHYFEERLLTFHKKIHNPKDVKSFSCSECGKIFKSKKSRYLHIAKIHRNEPAYSCNKCDEVFFSYHLRYKHKIEEHGEHRVFPCENCDKVYNSRKSLREHNRKSHLLLLKHECSQCERKFYLPSQLKDHMTSHTGERNFRCEYCGKSYPRLKSLKVHMDSHNTEKRYKCGLCAASYTQLNNFKNHMKSKHQSMENGSQFS